MALMELNSIKGLKVITEDAYDIGTVIDLRYRGGDWKVMGVKVGATNRPRELKPELRNNIMLETSGSFGYALKDVFLTRKNMKDTVTRLSPDTNKYDLASSLIGNKVKDNSGTIIGTVENLHFDSDGWVLVSLTVKLSPDGHKFLNVKKGLIGSKKISGVLMTFVESAKDGAVSLKVDCGKLRSSIIIED